MSTSLSSGNLKALPRRGFLTQGSRNCKICVESTAPESSRHKTFSDSLESRRLDADIRAGLLCQNLRTGDERRPKHLKSKQGGT